MGVPFTRYTITPSGAVRVVEVINQRVVVRTDPARTIQVELF